MIRSQFLILSLILAALPLSAAPVAALIKVKGEVSWSAAGANPSWVSAKAGQALAAGALLKTGGDGLAMVKFLDDNSMVRLKPNSQLAMGGKSGGAEEGKKVRVDGGSVLFNIKKKISKNRFDVETPTSVATVKGTQFWITVEGDSLTLCVVLQGVVGMKHGVTGAEQDVEPGQTARANRQGIVVRQSSEGDLPQGENSKTLEFRFRDKDGNLKKLDVDYDERK